MKLSDISVCLITYDENKKEERILPELLQKAVWGEDLRLLITGAI